MAIDDERYEKLTVWLPSGVPEGAQELDLADRSVARVVYSRGGPAWPDADCSGYVSAGRLRLEPRGTRYTVRIHGSFEPDHSLEHTWCATEPVTLEFEAGLLPFEELTPWLGRGARDLHPYDETYRALIDLSAWRTSEG